MEGEILIDGVGDVTGWGGGLRCECATGLSSEEFNFQQGT